MEKAPESTKLGRPDFGPTQVKSPDQISVGGTYISRHNINLTFNEGTITITHAPYQDEQGQWWVEGELKAPYLDGEAQVKFRLADHSVVPYPNDHTWNNASWMEDPEKVKPAEEK